MIKWFCLFYLVAFLPTGFVSAQDFADLDTGFDLNTAVEIQPLEEVDVFASSSSLGQFYGFVREEWGYAPQKKSKNWAKHRTILNLTYDIALGADWKIRLNGNAFYDFAYSYNGKENYTPETLKTYESEVEARDTFIEGAVSSWLNVRAGRQIIAWGQSEVSQLNDLANPRDLRELGVIDIEDARVQVTAVKWAALLGGSEFNLVTIHEFRPDKTPSAGSEFDFLAPLRAQANILDAPKPDPKIELLARWFIPYNGGDLAFYYGDVYQDQATLAFHSFDAKTQSLTLESNYLPIQSMGFAANQVWGAWLFRLEAAKKKGVPIQRSDLQTQLAQGLKTTPPPADLVYGADLGLVESYALKEQVQLALGVEYSGYNDVTFSFEISGDQILDYQENLKTKKFNGISTFILSHQAFNDNLTTRFLWFHFTDSNGELYRLSSDYSIMDAVSLGGGFVYYQPINEQSLLYPFKDNSRLNLTGKYSF